MMLYIEVIKEKSLEQKHFAQNQKNRGHSMIEQNLPQDLLQERAEASSIDNN